MLDLSNVWPEWQAVELLGEGSFGKVYRCVREEYGMKFESAVKVISLPSSRAEVDSFVSEGMSEEQIKTFYAEIVEDFANEIKMLFMLKGAPNIVAVENYKIVERKNEIGWDIYILMEYLESFAKYSHGKNLTEADIKALALDMCTALKSCGKYNVIHRDIKPGNIFIDRFGSFKLGDFSIARQLEGTMDFMSKKGTFGYMAPEVFRGESYDFRVDIYSLGRVLYKLLNRNKEPFIDVNKEFVSFKDRNDSLERIRKGEKLPAPVDASPAMAAVILKACEYDAADRFASVDEFKAALEAVQTVSEEPTVAAKDYFEKTVAARDFELPTPVPAEADSDDDTVVIAPVDEEATELMGEEPTVMADDEATAVADNDATVMATPDPDATMLADAPYDEPTVMAEKGDIPAVKDSKNKKTKIIIFAILGVLAVAAVVLAILFGTGILGSSKQNQPPAEPDIEALHYHYVTAKEMIDLGNYTEAYSHLIQCLGYEDTNEMLENFTFANVVRTQHNYAKDGSEEDYYYMDYRCDNHGNIISTLEIYGDNRTEEYADNVYDDYGNLISKTWYDENHVMLSKTEFEYDIGGNVRYYTWYDENGNVSQRYEKNEYGDVILDISYDESGEISFYDEYYYEYDENCNKTLEICYDENGSVTSTQEYRYDNDGNMIFHRDQYGERHYSEYEYRYDEYGNIIYESQSGYEQETDEYTYVYEYDERGNVLSKSVSQLSGNVVEYECEYDEYGWETKERFYNDGVLTSYSEYNYEFTENSITVTNTDYYEDGSISCEYIGTFTDPVYYEELR